MFWVVMSSWSLEPLQVIPECFPALFFCCSIYNQLKKCVDDWANWSKCRGRSSLVDEIFLEVHEVYFSDCGRVHDPPLTTLIMLIAPATIVTLFLPLLCANLTVRDPSLWFVNLSTHLVSFKLRPRFRFVMVTFFFYTKCVTKMFDSTAVYDVFIASTNTDRNVYLSIWMTYFLSYDELDRSDNYGKPRYCTDSHNCFTLSNLKDENTSAAYTWNT